MCPLKMRLHLYCNLNNISQKFYYIDRFVFEATPISYCCIFPPRLRDLLSYCCLDGKSKNTE